MKTWSRSSGTGATKSRATSGGGASGSIRTTSRASSRPPRTPSAATPRDGPTSTASAAKTARRPGSGKAIGPEEWGSRRAIAEGEISRDELIDINTFDGQRRTIENYAAPMRDGAGNITGAVVVNDDVTDQVRAEEALRKTERLLVE